MFFYFVLFIVLISGYEWARLSGLSNVFLRSLFALVVTAVAWLLVKYAAGYILWPVYLACVWWLVITFYLRIAQPKAPTSDLKADKLVIAFVVLPAAALAMREIHSLEQGADWLFYSLSLVWVADIGAYFSGKNFGKHKLAPMISPGKTIEGLIGALVATSLYTMLAGYYFTLSFKDAALLVVLSVMLTLVSVSGDLYISLLKREAGLKDSGNILPGHGGMLDRIDSALAAMPVFVLVFNWLFYSRVL